MFDLWRAAAAVAFAFSAALVSAEDMTEGQLGGTLVRPAPYAATVVVVPASPRSPAPYRAFADALQDRGFGSLVLDDLKKPHAKAVAASAAAADAATGSPCIWLLGHGKGGQAALAAAQRADNVCGVILVSTSGRSKSARLAATLTVPLMIVSGGQDRETGPKEGAAIRVAQPDARHAVVLEMDHLLRSAAAGTGAASPLSPKLVDLVTAFMLEKGPQVQGSLDPKESKTRGSRRAAVERAARPAKT